MSLFNDKKSMPRYSVIAIIITFIALAVQVKTLYIMTAERDFWTQVGNRVKKDSITTRPIRGNILSCDGQLMASSLPNFKLYVDFNAIHNAKNDSLFEVKLDSIANGLSAIFPEKSAKEFKEHLMEGFEKRHTSWAIWKRRVSYSTMCEVRKLPIFRLNPNKGGFKADSYEARQRPYGSLAKRTIGSLFGEKDSAVCGLELYYDSLLRGEKGIRHVRKVLNRYLPIDDTPPVNGYDIVTTIDVSMQDLAERALLKELNKINGNVGVAIVMEVKTGNIKAIVNMERGADGKLYEMKNHAISDLMEPGSVFKTVSLMTVLEDGMCDTSRVVETGNGIFDMHGRPMRDHNWRHNGYGTITMARSLEVSSNIGVSRIVEDYYGKNPEKFVEGVYRTGITTDFKLPLNGYAPARVRMPKKNARGQWLNWSKTSLAWMSIGYETQIPPISTLAFYNAIANGGRMMYPRFVTGISKNGEMLMTFPAMAVPGHEKICSQRTLGKVQAMLEHVVSKGTAKKAGSKAFKIAGKTGTAQVAQGGSYRNGTMKYLLSFVGYFPADAPRYSCIVCIQKKGLPASSGFSAIAFREIAEGIMAQNLKMDVRDAKDEHSIMVPDVKAGNINSAGNVLHSLGVRTQGQPWNDSQKPVWGTGSRNRHSVTLNRVAMTPANEVPDVKGMGARDAVYLMESRGIKVTLKGRGKVCRQSLQPGQRAVKGQRCHLILE